MSRCDGCSKGRFTRDFYVLPTILIHRGDGLYTTVELAWFKWYIGFVWHKKGE